MENDAPKKKYFHDTVAPEFITPHQYTKEKLRILKRDFCINITPEEKAHVYNLKTEGDINRACLGLINKYYGAAT